MVQVREHMEDKIVEKKRSSLTSMGPAVQIYSAGESSATTTLFW